MSQAATKKNIIIITITCDKNRDILFKELALRSNMERKLSFTREQTMYVTEAGSVYFV